MKHAIKGRKLGRNSAHRKALFRNMSVSIIKHGIIKTTVAKAKEIRPYLEKIVTAAKVDNLANRRHLISILGSDEVIDRLFKIIAPVVATRNGGYLRIMKYGFRTGDKAPMAIVEFVDREKFPADEVAKNSEAKTKTPKAKASKALAPKKAKSVEAQESAAEDKKEKTAAPKVKKTTATKTKKEA